MSFDEVFRWLGPIFLWTVLFKIFPEFLGGASIKAVEAKFQRDLERLKGDLLLSTTKEIEPLKAKVQAVSASTKNSVDFLSSNLSELRSKSISGAEELWKEMIRLRSAHEVIPNSDLILTRAELENAITSGSYKGFFDDFDKYISKSFLSDTVDKTAGPQSVRLFVGDRLWVIFWTYRVAILRPAVMLNRSFETGKYEHWQDDRPFRVSLLPVLPDAVFEEASKKQLGGLAFILSNLEAAFLKEASRVMSGSQAFAEAMSDVQATVIAGTKLAAGQQS